MSAQIYEQQQQAEQNSRERQREKVEQDMTAPLRPRAIRPRPCHAQTGYSASAVSESDKTEAEASATKVPLGCFWSFMAMLLFIPIGLFLRRHSGLAEGLEELPAILLCAGMAYVATKLSRYLVYLNKLQTITMKRLEDEQAAREQNEEDATLALTAKVRQLYDEQRSNLAALDNLVRNTRQALSRAEQLFSERAYTPFWDSIEDAVEYLRQFDRRVGYISESAKKYYMNLAGREHSFPPFPLNCDDLPTPDGLLKHLTETIGVAQRDFQFAQIFEQRRTTSAIVTGFRNTQEAIFSLRNDLVNSLSNLQRSLEDGLADISSNVRDGFADMAERHERSASDLRETLDRHAQDGSTRGAKHEEFVEGALDNIQNKREPRMSETKEPFRPK